jgi:hypothetical protein
MFQVMLLALLPQAPAPLVRDNTVPGLDARVLAGKWVMTWGSVECPTILSPNGTYKCRYSSLDYAGTWASRGRYDIIIAEAPALDAAAGPGAFSSWVLRVKKDKKGRFDRDNFGGEVLDDEGRPFLTFSLRRVK